MLPDSADSHICLVGCHGDARTLDVVDQTRKQCQELRISETKVSITKL